jgi:replicative DNA helicase
VIKNASWQNDGYIEVARMLNAAAIPTGFGELDDLTRGLHFGELTVIAGEPGAGKSTLALDFARSAAYRNGRPTLLFALESTSPQISNRILAAEAGVPLTDLQGAKVDDEQMHKLQAAREQTSHKPLFLDRSVYPTAQEIWDRCEQLKQELGLALIVIDSLQRIKHNPLDTTGVPAMLKNIALDLQVPLVVTSHVTAPGRLLPLTVSDLPDPDIAVQADVIMFVKTLFFADSGAELLVAKHREGETRKIPVHFQPHFSRFRDTAA